jgi:hypothetical protein
MSLIVIVIIVQAVSSMLAWLGFYVGIRAAPRSRGTASARSILSIPWALTNGGAGGIAFPLVLIPAYGVPRAFLIHSYSLDWPAAQDLATARRAASLKHGMGPSRIDAPSVVAENGPSMLSAASTVRAMTLVQ